MQILKEKINKLKNITSFSHFLKNFAENIFLSRNEYFAYLSVTIVQCVYFF